MFAYDLPKFALAALRCLLNGGSAPDILDAKLLGAAWLIPQGLPALSGVNDLCFGVVR